MIVRILASVAGTIAASLAGGLAYRKGGQRRVAKPLMIGIPNGIVEERFVGIDPPRSFEPLGNKMIAGVHVDLPHPPGAGVDELVRHAGSRSTVSVPGGATTTCPPLTSIVSSPAVKVALPSCTTKTSSYGCLCSLGPLPGASTTRTETLAPRRRP